MRTILLTSILLTSWAYGQQPQRTIGELTEKESAGLTIKADGGATAAVTVDDHTSYLKVPPGETSLAKAAKISFADLAVGDRLLVTGGSPAQRVIVMTKSDLAQRQAADRTEWQRRGAHGTVTAVDAASKQITVKQRALGVEKALTVEVTPKTQFRRYAPDSVKFSDAKPSSLAEIAPGNQLRILGEKPLEDGKITAEAVVSGSFRNVAGTVLSVNPAEGELQLRNLETKQPLTVKVNPDSVMRRMPPMMAQMLASRLSGKPAGQPEPGSPQAAGGPRGPGGPGGGPGGPRGGDMQSMLERMPAFQISDLKPGDALIVNSTTGAQEGRVTAISMLAGVEPLLTAPAAEHDRRLNGPWNMGDINIMP